MKPRTLAVAIAGGLAVATAGCSGPQAAPADASPTTAPAPTQSAHLPETSPAAALGSAAAPIAASAAPPLASAASSASAGAPPQVPPPSEAPLPKVKIETFGMHIGGGPNDAATKRPFRASVEPHFDDFRRCFALVEDPKKSGSVGVDLLVGKDGGKPEVTRPRATLEGKPFRECVVHVFEGMDFEKPPTGKTKLSYSLLFTP